MDRLWAPWRMDYVKQNDKAKKGCFLCQKRKSRKDAENYVVKRTRYSFALLNIFPYNNGHLMIAPKRHVRDITLLTKAELNDLMSLVVDMQRLLEKATHPQGFNIGINSGDAAGAGLASHIHVHIVPRWVGDTNYMPVIGGTKVISQALDALYQALMKRKK